MKEDAPKEEEAKLKSSQAKPADTVNMATDNVEEQTELDTKDDDKKAEPESAEATKEGAKEVQASLEAPKEPEGENQPAPAKDLESES